MHFLWIFFCKHVILQNWRFIDFHWVSTVMQIEKSLINDPLRASKVSWIFQVSAIYNFAVIFPWNLLFLRKKPAFKKFLLFFLFTNKTLPRNNLKFKTTMNSKISVFVISVEAIIYLLLYDLHDCTFCFFFCLSYLVFSCVYSLS